MLAASAGPGSPRRSSAHGAALRRALGHGDPGGHRELRRDGRRAAAPPRSRSAPPGRRSSPGARPGDPLDVAPHVRGLGRAALHGRRARAGPGGRGRDAGPPRTARLRRLMAVENADPEPTRSTSRSPERPERPSCSRWPTACRRSPTPTQALAEACARDRGRHRPGRDRRRAGVGLPLLQPRLPDPAAPRGRRHRAHRPDRLRLPRPAAGGARGHRVDPARRHPGPALPRRRRPGARRRCSTPSWPDGCSATPGSAWPRWWRRCSATG